MHSSYIHKLKWDGRTNKKQMDGRMNKETNARTDEQTKAMRGIQLSTKTDKQ
jgi:hypothetical protein